MARASVTNHRMPTGPRVRRGYFECRFGQLHMHNAIPPGGGFDEGTALLCLHPVPRSARMFRAFLPLAGVDRSVYAPDLPGCGESDPPPGRPTVGDYVAAIGDFLDAMRFKQIDVLGYHAGSLLAAELAVARPKQVRRVVMVGVPLPTQAEREALERTVRASIPPGESAQFVTDLCWPPADSLDRVTQPVRVLRLKDELWELTPRVRERLTRASIVELPELGSDAFDAAPAKILEAIRDFIQG